MSNSWLSRRAGPGGGRHATSWPVLTCHFCLEPSLVLPRSTSSGEHRLDPSVASGSKGAVESMRMSTGDPSSWSCSACSCWNRRDDRQPGGIASWEPAMADETANQQRLELRGKRPASQLSATASSTGTTSPFCHTCSTNQSLVLSLLANYLPDPSSVSEAELQRLEDELPAYRQSIEQRYPALCDRCEPVVRDRLQGADKMVRSNVWAAWLERSRQERDAPADVAERRPASLQARMEVEGSLDWVWRVRGALWLASHINGCLLCLIVFAGACETSSTLAPYTRLLAKGTILSAPLSLLWTFWNPRWLALTRLHRRGQRKAHVAASAHQRWVSTQGALFIVRLVLALPMALPSQAQGLTTLVLHLASPLVASLRGCTFINSLADPLHMSHVMVALLLIQPSLCIWAYQQLQIRHGNMVQLSTSLELAKPEEPLHIGGQRGFEQPCIASQRRRAGQPGREAIDPISALSLGGRHHNPIFGQASLPLDRLLDGDQKGLPPGEEMDWQPTTTAGQSRSAFSSSSTTDEGFVLGPQRFFPPESVTGVEELFGSVLDLGSSSTKTASSTVDAEIRSRGRARTISAAALVVSTALLAALLAWAPSGHPALPSMPRPEWLSYRPVLWRSSAEVPSSTPASPPILQEEPIVTVTIEPASSAEESTSQISEERSAPGVAFAEALHHE